MSNYIFKEMNVTDAKIMETWKYKGHVKSIGMDSYFESYEKTGVMRGPGNCFGYAVYDQNELIGLFEYYTVNDIMQLGLALSPNKVGLGLGKEFVLSGVEFGIKTFHYEKEYIKLNVNEQNKPAVQVYLHAGFVKHLEDDGNIEMRKYIK